MISTATNSFLCELSVWNLLGWDALTFRDRGMAQSGGWNNKMWCEQMEQLGSMYRLMWVTGLGGDAGTTDGTAVPLSHMHHLSSLAVDTGHPSSNASRPLVCWLCRAIIEHCHCCVGCQAADLSQRWDTFNFMSSDTRKTGQVWSSTRQQSQVKATASCRDEASFISRSSARVISLISLSGSDSHVGVRSKFRNMWV